MTTRALVPSGGFLRSCSCPPQPPSGRLRGTQTASQESIGTEMGLSVFNRELKIENYLGEPRAFPSPPPPPRPDSRRVGEGAWGRGRRGALRVLLRVKIGVRFPACPISLVGSSSDDLFGFRRAAPEARPGGTRTNHQNSTPRGRSDMPKNGPQFLRGVIPPGPAPSPPPAPSPTRLRRVGEGAGGGEGAGPGGPRAFPSPPAP